MTLHDAEAERIKSAASIFGRKGGAAKGPRKARTPDFYRRIGKLGVAARRKNKPPKAT